VDHRARGSHRAPPSDRRRLLVSAKRRSQKTRSTCVVMTCTWECGANSQPAGEAEENYAGKDASVVTRSRTRGMSGKTAFMALGHLLQVRNNPGGGVAPSAGTPLMGCLSARSRSGLTGPYQSTGDAEGRAAVPRPAWHMDLPRAGMPKTLFRSSRSPRHRATSLSAGGWPGARLVRQQPFKL